MLGAPSDRLHSPYPTWRQVSGARLPTSGRSRRSGGYPLRAAHQRRHLDNPRGGAAGRRGDPLPLPDAPLAWIEHHPPLSTDGDTETFDLVTFSSYGIREGTVPRRDAPDGGGGHLEAHHQGYGRGARGRRGVGSVGQRPSPRDHTDAAKDIARELSEAASHLAAEIERLGGRTMQDPVSELPRTLLLGSRVNRGTWSAACLPATVSDS